MTDHLVMPPIVLSRFATHAFDARWLTAKRGEGAEVAAAEASDLRATHVPCRWSDPRFDVDCGTVAAARVMHAAGRANREERPADGVCPTPGIASPACLQGQARGAGADSPAGLQRGRPSVAGSSASSAAWTDGAALSAPTGAMAEQRAAGTHHADADLAGCSLRRLIEHTYIDPALRRWRTAVQNDGIDVQARASDLQWRGRRRGGNRRLSAAGGAASAPVPMEEDDDEAAAEEGDGLWRGAGRVPKRGADNHAAMASGSDEEAGEATEDAADRHRTSPPAVTAKQLGRPRLHPEPQPRALPVPYLPGSLQDAAMLREISRVPSREAIITALSERFACALALPALLPPARPVRVFPLPLQAGEEGGCAATRVTALAGLDLGRAEHAAPSSEGTARRGSHQSSAAHAGADAAPPRQAGCSARPLPPPLPLAAAAAPTSQHGQQERRQHNPERGAAAAPEVVLRIAVYAPDECGQRRHAFGLRPTQELEVLGSTPLSALLSLLYCPHDWVLPGAAARRGRAMLYCEGLAYCVEPEEDDAAEEGAAVGSSAVGSRSVNGPFACAVAAAAAPTAAGPAPAIETSARGATTLAARPLLNAAVAESGVARAAAVSTVGVRPPAELAATGRPASSLPLPPLADMPSLLPLDWQIPPELAALAARMSHAGDSSLPGVPGMPQLPSSLPPAVSSSGSGYAAGWVATAPPAPVASPLGALCSDPFLAALAAMAAGGPKLHSPELAGQRISRSPPPSSDGEVAVSVRQAGADSGPEGLSAGRLTSPQISPRTVLPSASVSSGQTGVLQGFASSGLHLVDTRMSTASSGPSLPSVAAADSSASGVADHALAYGLPPFAGATTNPAAVGISDPFLAAMASVAAAQASAPAAAGGNSDPFLAALASMVSGQQGSGTSVLTTGGSASLVPAATCDHASAAILAPSAAVDDTTVCAERAHAPDGRSGLSGALADSIAAAIQAIEGADALPNPTAREGLVNVAATTLGVLSTAVAESPALAAVHRPRARVPDAAASASPAGSAAHPLSAAHGSLLGMLRDSLASDSEAEEGGGADAMGHGSMGLAEQSAAGDPGAALRARPSAPPTACASDMATGQATSAEHVARQRLPPPPSRPIPSLTTSYGAPIAEWANRELEAGVATGWGPLQARRMRGVRFADLSVRLGAHYLYVHQGSCEHILVFTDCRLHNVAADGPLSVQQCAAEGGAGSTRGELPGRHSLVLQYPRLVSQLRYKRRRCSACAARPAARVVYGDPYGQENPEYYCAECYGLLHGGVCAEASAAAAGLPRQAGEANHEGQGTRSPPFSSLPYRHETTALASTLQ